ncbi:DUF6204 family protein [Actinoplanes sp. TRM 88003]|uniref:DUF6204 family protein n=1 Tax=Paractinoplanes aksuensis TaxID=2939490 RepID=A0ABT1DFR0_9ACTN|nr:DUF6204 family protein [Actinoplanes aksuensis]MCO8269660.1 DUF6204 family protein [Actinoplanes aksuensis]
MGRTVRVTVRGSFDGLSEAQVAELRAGAAAHDFMNTQYTAEGYLAYDLARPFFTFRFAEVVEGPDEVAAAGVRAQVKAEAWMAEHGYPIKGVSVQTVDMAEVPLGKRGRREASRQP